MFDLFDDRDYSKDYFIVVEDDDRPKKPKTKITINHKVISRNKDWLPNEIISRILKYFNIEADVKYLINETKINLSKYVKLNNIDEIIIEEYKARVMIPTRIIINGREISRGHDAHPDGLINRILEYYGISVDAYYVQYS
ncbi:MAG: hypothetical protein K9N05_07300 [Candidatus Marinimicrobia bacterium]|nr:hypothetical protein [Candidatus Neomarinimicrobiota bacterium]